MEEVKIKKTRNKKPIITDHKLTGAERQKRFYEKHKESIKQRIECELCGRIVSKVCLKRHQENSLCLKNRKY
jgi:hypothetical protein